tara:strand:- start:52 stop:264 length:213 start_codon:yes stop_codon:yes gene_type:complete
MAKFKNVCGQVIQMTSQEETEFDNFQTQATKDFNDFIKEEETKDANKISGKKKLKDLGLNDDEIKALTGA